MPWLLNSATGLIALLGSLAATSALAQGALEPIKIETSVLTKARNLHLEVKIGRARLNSSHT